MAHILIVDDEPHVRAVLARLITRHGHTVSQAADGVEGVAAIQSLALDLVVTDMEMPGGSGFLVLDAGSAAKVPVVILTAHASVELAVDAMKRGAANFLAKPFSAESVALMLQEAFVGRGSRPVSPPRAAEEAERPAASTSAAGTPSVVGDDEVFRQVLSIVDRVANTDATVLITGESGTGKEVVARAIHNASRRRDKPFVVVNCGAVPEALLESELFGHVRGAFTGATQARRGRFQVAEGGTLFLDEIGDMPPLLQVKLLRVIQEREFEVLGDSRPQPANVRFIAATHRDLEAMVEQDRFRQDLFFRLNVVPLHLPPLRERPRDIPLLVAHFIGEANAAHGREVTGVEPDALQALLAYGWPGNVRELANIIERMTVLRGHGVIRMDDVPPGLRSPRLGGAPSATAVASAAGGVTGNPLRGASISRDGAAALDLPEGGLDLLMALDRYEGLLIEKALERTRGNRTQAAALLRINRTTLVEKLKRRDGAQP